MKKVAFYTLGCKVNQYETESIATLFKKNEYDVVDFEEKSDIYVINTCSVTSLSDRKSRQIIRRAKKNNFKSIIVVLGCYAQVAPQEVNSIPEVDIVLGTNGREKIIEYIKSFEEDKKKISVVKDIMKAKEFEELNIDSYRLKTRAFVKIQEGCNQFCTYCIIPYARGSIRSKDPVKVLTEIQTLAQNGFKEIILTGIHLASYGKDLKDTSLNDIILKIQKINGVERIRLGSIEPNLIADEFVKIIKDSSKLCSHFHVSLQSGCNETLKRMNRRYLVEDFEKSIGRLRSEISDVAITTDIIVGFPGETDNEFEKTYSFLSNIKLQKMHVFKYSRRKGTKAYSFENQVSSIKKEERSNILLDLSVKNQNEFNNKNLDRVFPVLIEKASNYGSRHIEGLTPNNIEVVCVGDIENHKGSIVNVRLIENKGEFVLGVQE